MFSRLFFLSLVAVVAGVSGCSTIVSGTQQSVFVDTPHVVGANCDLMDSRMGQWYLPHTPGVVTVAKGNGPLHVVCQMEGYETSTVSVDETVAAATFGNVILGGGIGILVDAASGAAQHYPDRITVWMQPARFVDDEDRITVWMQPARFVDDEDRMRWLVDRDAFGEAGRKRREAAADITGATR